MTELYKSKPVVEKQLLYLKDKCLELKKKGVEPSMKVILVGNNPASLIYTRNKKKFCEKFEALCEIIHLDEGITEKEFLEQVKEISNDQSVHGCFIQLPLPSQLKHIDVGNLIPPEKDVDGFHKDNLNMLLHGDEENALLPCTPKGIITMLEHYGESLEGKNVVVIGRSMIVGKPMTLMMINKNATATICHSRTKDLKAHTMGADIIVSAVGKAKFLNKEFLNQDGNQVLIDVGMNHDSDGKLCGDIDREDVLEHCKAITPVPGGVGPMTILSLAQNLLQAAEKSLYK
ncbi:MAG: bifunctional 5,10-methylenetetrahydrofolate dehydrogenase/5,10-methenyltetrahydrofolate cyclohydrolase [Bacteriovoracaceae bacterium]|nr:bifunctional 5,10-methylenetetrahydrofolate dehydrogenase/5,10-methenyltetrahydrofolate cyclohydrolase [Bacteriovoracaceae bacterium]